MSEIKQVFYALSPEELSPVDRLLYDQYLDRLEGANSPDKERRHRRERIHFVACELRRRGQCVFPSTVRALYQQLFTSRAHWSPQIYVRALTESGWIYVSRRVGYEQRGEPCPRD